MNFHASSGGVGRRARREALPEIAADNFFSISEIRGIFNRARLRGQAALRNRDATKNWRRRAFGVSARQALDFSRNGQGKSLEILGESLENVWKSLDFPWRNLEILGKVWRCGDGPPPEALMQRRPKAVSKHEGASGAH